MTEFEIEEPLPKNIYLRDELKLPVKKVLKFNKKQNRLIATREY